MAEGLEPRCETPTSFPPCGNASRLAWPPEERRLRSVWLWGTAAAYAAGAGVCAFALMPPVQRPLETTMHLERLADKGEHAARMPLETAVTLAALTHHPRYDCRQMQCTPLVAARNARARERLQLLVTTAIASSPSQVTGSLSRPPITPAALQE